MKNILRNTICSGVMILAAVCFGSCKKTEMTKLPEYHLKPANYHEQFVNLWSMMNSSYAMWDLETMDWDQMYFDGLPVMDKWDEDRKNGIVVPDADFEKFYQDMFRDLHDYHFSLSLINLGTGNKIVIDPAGIKEKNRSDYHPRIKAANFFNMTVKYIQSGVIRNSAITQFEFDKETHYVCTGMIDDDILYFRLSVFGLSANMESSPLVIGVIDQFLALQEKNPSAVIIDLRSNPGGYDSDHDYILSTLIDEPMQIGYFKSKEGPGRYDMSAALPMFIKPSARHHYLGKDVPIIVMTDPNSASNSEVTAMAVKQLPDGNGIVAGERSYGGIGAVIGYYYFYAGQASNVDDSITISGSFGIRYDNDFNCYEAVGIEPTEGWGVKFDQSKWDAGVDNMLDFVVEKIRTTY